MLIDVKKQTTIAGGVMEHENYEIWNNNLATTMETEACARIFSTCMRTWLIQ